ncbi:homoserine dehydrogenase [Gemmatimonas aurantiaca]|uniref:homoserine dehydrogenase n=1 Tax=Gemmatimonas aurantiaca TaxID=173480 RepID=UPI00301DDE29
MSPAPAATLCTDECITLYDVPLDSGERLEHIDVHFRLEGTIDATADNVVLVVHALTGTADASTWWKDVIGEGCVIDLTRHAVLSASLLGGCDGTTGPSNADPDALPPITTRDQARVLARLLDTLGVDTPLLICGGSLGGMVTLEFAASFPKRVRGAVVFAAPAAQTAQGLAWNALMRRAIAIGGTHDGLALARMIGMLSYRTPESLERRFGRARSVNDGFKVNEWLDVHGERLVARFDATSYGALIDAMDVHDVGRGRGGLSAALEPVADRLTGVGIPGDLLYPAECVREWTAATGATYVDLPSLHGHDAFLLEVERVSQILGKALLEAEARVTHRIAPRVTLGAAYGATHGVSHAVAFGARHDVDRPVQSRVAPRVTRGAAPSVPPRVARPDGTPSAPPAVRPLRVALAGCGHVGGSLLELLSNRHVEGTSRITDAPDVHVARILVRDATRERPALTRAIGEGITSATACITDPAHLLGDDIDVLVEAIGGTDVARTLVESALARGIRVVTANKALLGARGEALQRLAQAHATRLDFEGAVCGAIPIVRCVRSGAAGVGITRVSGILNGTSNFVLGQVAEGRTLAAAIATAQELGYAEADPTRDLNGQDVEDKLRVLAWLTFGVEPASLKVTRRGIDAEIALWAAQVALEGDRVKLVATCERDGEDIVARILPTRVRGDDPWAAVNGPFNRVVIESESAGSLVFQGPGAGGPATAGAVLADLLG